MSLRLIEYVKCMRVEKRISGEYDEETSRKRMTMKTGALSVFLARRDLHLCSRRDEAARAAAAHANLKPSKVVAQTVD